MQRRTFLVSAAAASLSAWAPWGRGARAEGGAQPGLIQLTSRPQNLEAPLEAYLTRVTPTELFYVRSHFDPPAVAARDWRVTLDGLVEAPQTLGLRELERQPQVELEAVLQCAGNGRALFRPHVGGVLWSRGAMGNGVWGGVRIQDLARLARPRKEARHVLLTGYDRPTLPSTPAFVRSIPIEKALEDDTMIALRLNGKPLPRLNGGPARLVVPGWVADDWTKWIASITFSATPATGFYYEKAYRYPDRPGAPGEAVPAVHMKPMTAMNVKSVIAAPIAGSVLKAGQRHELVGVAFSGGPRVTRVEVSTNGGASWRAAELEQSPSPFGFTRFRHAFVAEQTGPALLKARATDESGAQQPDEPVWNPSGYLYNAVDVVPVEVQA